jgi:hypothetical protein
MLQHLRLCLLSVVAVETIFWLPSEVVLDSRSSLTKRRGTAALQQYQAVNLPHRAVRAVMVAAAMLLVVVLPALWPVRLLPESPRLAIVVSLSSEFFWDDHMLTIFQTTKMIRMIGRFLRGSNPKAHSFSQERSILF